MTMGSRSPAAALDRAASTDSVLVRTYAAEVTYLLIYFSLASRQLEHKRRTELSTGTLSQAKHCFVNFSASSEK